VQAGQVYTAAVWAQAWSSATDDPRKSEAEIYVTIGINPRGDCARTAKDTVWSNWQWIGSTYRRVESQQVRMIGDKACVAILSSTKYSVKHNDMYIDDAEMAMVVQSGDCPACPTCPECPGSGGDCITQQQLDATFATWFAKLKELVWGVK
jgi:hypothetical protein